MDVLIKKLAEIQQHGVTKFVAICGAADLGKTTLARQLVARLQALHVTADTLSMDAYLIPRPQRQALSISGYDPQAYEWQRLVDDVELLQRGTPIQLSEYNHKAGLTNGPCKLIKPATLMLIDGLHSMHQRLMPYVAFSVFIFTSDERLIIIRHKADLVKRNQSAAFSLSQAESEFQKYKSYVEPYRKKADMVLMPDNNWQYTVDRCRLLRDER